MRARRGILLGGLCILGGGVVSVLVAEGIGYSGAARHVYRGPQLFLALGNNYVQASETTGPGWRFLQWDFENQQEAATNQEGAENPYFESDSHSARFNAVVDASRLHCDPPESLPRWCHLWSMRNELQSKGAGAVIEHGHVIEVALGWPLRALSIEWDQLPPNEARCGWMLAPSLGGGQRVLAWRPIPLGLAADTLFYAVGVAGLVGGGRLLVRGRRRRRGACVACGYDRRGLAAGALCPECGGAGVCAQVRA